MRSKILSKQSSFLLTLKCVGIEEGYIAFYSISVCNDDVIFETEVWDKQTTALQKDYEHVLVNLWNQLWFLTNFCVTYRNMSKFES